MNRACEAHLEGQENVDEGGGDVRDDDDGVAASLLQEVENL
jgi:hypothetical protein